MKYTQDEFFRLMEAIEAADGEHLDEVHDPVFHSSFTGPNKLPSERDYTMPYCGEVALFKIPYDDGTAVPASVKVCAVDDMIGRWPRFKAANAEGKP